MPTAIAAKPAPGGPHPEADLLDAIKDVQQALVVRLIPKFVRRGLGNHAFWPLWYLGRGSEHHPGELAARMGLTPAALTATIDQLVGSGYVVRSPSSADRRQVVLSVTAKGRRTLEELWQELDASLGPALADLRTEDVRTTTRTLHELADRLRAQGDGRTAEGRP
jgi:DNA-binding MarR family transcriptional regulator